MLEIRYGGETSMRKVRTMSQPPKPAIYYRLNIEILRIIEERLSVRLAGGSGVDPRALATEIINDDLSKGFSWHELLEIIEVAAEEMNVPIVGRVTRMSGEH